MFLFVIFILTIMGIIFAFASRIPSVSSTPKSDLDKVIDSCELKNDQVVFDLGAGHGRMIFAAASKAMKNKLNTKFMALEINHFFVLILFMRRLLHPNKKNIQVGRCDFLNYDYEPIVEKYKSAVFYLYIPPWLIFPVVTRLRLTGKPIRIISYKYNIETLYLVQKIEGRHPIYIYDL